MLALPGDAGKPGTAGGFLLPRQRPRPHLARGVLHAARRQRDRRVGLAAGGDGDVQGGRRAVFNIGDTIGALDHRLGAVDGVVLRGAFPLGVDPCACTVLDFRTGGTAGGSPLVWNSPSEEQASKHL